ncbi:MAG: hypothetical protein RR811_15895, partial [Comamonas sp.]
GKTSSESKLLQLVRGSMLSLWSIPGPYTNEGLARCGAGTELCDLVVIFEDNVLLFSDKDCVFPEHTNAKVAWSRWYRRAIEKSARQLSGAAASVQRHGVRLFSDATCRSELPLQLPPVERMRIHRIAVAHGSMRATELYWESFGGTRGSSGSLFLNNQLIGKEHYEEPFHIGWPLGLDEFVHVLDDLTLSLLLQELDTVADFTDYLAKKEKLLRMPGCHFLIPGEEELLTMYLSTVHKGKTNHFPDFECGAAIVLREGTWNKFRRSKAYAARSNANALSYLWDNLIEYQASHVIHGSSEELFVGENYQSLNISEKLLRVMASENRLSRRSLGVTLREGRNISSGTKRLFRTIAMSDRQRLYCFVFLPYFPKEQQHEEYRQYRQYLLHLYCEGALLHFDQVKEIIGIAPDPYSSDIASVDFMFLNVRDTSINSEDLSDLKIRLRRENVWNGNQVRTQTVYDVAFPYYPNIFERALRVGKRITKKFLLRTPRA